jgi:hypothetical protein
MTEVTVDLADLETLVYTSGVLKTIEGALQSRKTDPFVRPYLNFTEAHDRLAAAMRNATRGTADTLVKWDEPLEAYERAFLVDLIKNEDVGNSQIITPDYRLDHPEIDRLMCKGAIVIGQLCKGILWGGKNEIEWSPDPAGFAVESTARGRNKLIQHAA